MELKILILSHKFYPSIGGIETFSEILAEHFTNSGNKVRILTWSTDETNKRFNFEIVRKPNWKTITKEIAWADVVLENNPCLRLSWPNIIYKRPSVIILQTWLPDSSSQFDISRKGKTWWLKKANQVVAISDAVRKKCWTNAKVIPNSYNFKIFNSKPNVVRTKDFVFVGRLVSDKGVDTAIKALHLLNKSTFDDINRKTLYNLTIIGEGPDKIKLEDLITTLGLQDQVKFAGALRGNNLANNLNEHKYLLVPSLWEEPFGIVALEGMACGCIPIVSDGGGLPEAIGNAGLTFKRGDEYSLLETLKSLLQDKLTEQQLRENAAIHLARHHPQKITESYLNLIKEIHTKNLNLN